MKRHKNMLTCATKQEALDIIEILRTRPYTLAHGEYERPDYIARKVRGRNRYYIHVKRYYHEGTLNAKKSGAMDGMEWDISEHIRI